MTGRAAKRGCGCRYEKIGLSTPQPPSVFPELLIPKELSLQVSELLILMELRPIELDRLWLWYQPS